MLNYSRKIIAICLLSALLILLFCGCSPQNHNSVPPQSDPSQTELPEEDFIKYGYTRPCDKNGNDIGHLIGAYNSANTYMKVYPDNTVELLHRADAVTIAGYLDGTTLYGTRNGEDIELYCVVNNGTAIVEYIKPSEHVQYLLFERQD